LLNLQHEDKTATVFLNWCNNGERGQDIIGVIRKLTISGIAKYSL